MIVCRDCKFYRAGHFGPSDGSPGKESICTLDLPTRTAPVTCRAARKGDGDCGPDALFFDDGRAAA